ncbi:Rha family transcriptional regulator [Weissella minor]|uniref:Rha family transcriptional regulator n=1 Tax=Weissella minor TaxID=1620 RepID=UPI001BB030C2|nr:Rha family transcriptional regulator [Weissella minor]MBS0950545.1 Rha family transcriptional regulator [Weissella minor]
MDNKYDQLVELQDGEATTTSLQIAKASGKKHKVVLEAIDGIILDLNKELAENSATSEMFKEAYYIHEQNHQKYRMFIINRDGWTMLLGSFNGSKYTLFRYEYMKQFNGMQKQLEQQAQQQFFIPETVEQQYKREQLAIRKQESENAKSREGRALLKLTKNDPALVKQIVPQLFASLLGAENIKQLELSEPNYIYSASAIGQKLGLEPYTVGSLAQELGIKATREEESNQFSKNTAVPLADGTFKSTWRYSEEAYQAMKEALEA